jgi:hypothetical protein
MANRPCGGGAICRVQSLEWGGVLGETFFLHQFFYKLETFQINLKSILSLLYISTAAGLGGSLYSNTNFSEREMFLTMKRLVCSIFNEFDKWNY